MTDSKPLVIDIDHVTKDYGQNRGNFDINLQVHDGECVGIVGENGAGKTTLLRQIMGFIRSDSGHVKIYHFDAYLDAADTKCYIGYIPGEINFPDVPTGIDFLHQYGYSLGMKPQDFGYADSIISRMQLDIRAYPRRMSKGMKQKTAIVASMMRKPPILLMDEPSTGLGPLMREELLTLIQEQKDRGSTMIMTSNSIDELERVSDRVVLMTQGRIVDSATVSDIKNRPERDFKIEFTNDKDYERFLALRNDIIRIQPQYHQATVRVEKKALPELLNQLKKFDVKFFTEVPYNLTVYFDERRKARQKEEVRHG